MSDVLFNQNYFEIFSQNISTQLDLGQLKDKNRELQQSMHPDRFANATDEEKRLAMQKTSLVNQAYNTLKDPVLRLQYMLSLQGIDMNAETDTSMDAAFLMEQMELREEIASVSQQADPLDALDAMSAKLKKQLNTLVDTFAVSYQQNDFEQGREIVRKCQFIQKAQKEISDTAEKLEDEYL